MSNASSTLNLPMSRPKTIVPSARLSSELDRRKSAEIHPTERLLSPSTTQTPQMYPTRSNYNNLSSGGYR